MPQDANHLIWIDMEMTGLKPETDRIIEVALVVTDVALVTVAEAPVLVVHQDDVTLAGLDEAQAEQRMLAFLREHVPPRISPMCGNSICQDRRFLARWMPALEDYFHYRNLDVSSLKELCRRWKPDVAKGWVKQGKHEALADIYESIDELKYYRDTFIRP